MKNISSDWILQKNKLQSTDPVYYLFEIELNDGSYWRFTAFTEDVTFGGNTYTAIPAVIDSFAEDTKNNASDVKIHVSNVDQTASAYVENNDLIGCTVTIRLAEKNLSDSIDFSFTILTIQLSSEAATFALGHENLMALKLPRHRYIRDKCRWGFLSDRCNFPSDEFEPLTKQELADERTSGSPFEKLYGWYIEGPHKWLTCDVSKTNKGYLTIQPDQSKNGYARLYKKFTSREFTFDAYLDNSAWDVNNPGVGVVMFIRDPNDYTVWARWKWVSANLSTSQPEAYLYGEYQEGTDSGAKSSVLTYKHKARLKRSSDTIGWWYWTGSEWELKGGRTFSDLPQILEVGLGTVVNSTDYSGTLSFKLAYYRVDITRGGGSCDLTFDGANGCIAHKNTPNYGGFPALPEGRLHGI